MPDRGEERITGFTASGLPFFLNGPVAQTYQQIIITAHKDMEERSKMWREEDKDRRERERSDIALSWRWEDRNKEPKAEKMMQGWSGSVKMKTGWKVEGESEEFAA